MKRLIALLIFGAVLLPACGSGSGSNGDRSFEAYFRNSNGSQTPVFKLELALTPAQRHAGLSFREPGSLSPDEGMLFVYPQPSVLSFYMKDTYIALDMIFIDSSLQVAGIIANATPLDETLRSIGVPSQYVVELLAGSAAESGIEKGSEFVPRDALPVVAE